VSTRLDALLAEQQRAALGRSLFEEWAREQPGCPRRPAELVHDVSLNDDYVGLFATRCEGRRATWRSVPSSAQVRLPARPIPATVDPWAADDRKLREATDHVEICSACNGAGKGSCPTCAGAGKLVCAECGGARKMYGYAANGAHRLLNCTRCRGKGDVDCGHCRRGIATCERCAGERRLQRWLEVERWTRYDTAECPAALAQRFGWSGVSANAEVERHGVVALDVECPRAIVSSDAPRLPSQWLDLAPRPRDGERVVQQRVRLVRVPKLVVRYNVGHAEGHAEFSGLALRPPSPARDAPFAVRATRLRQLGVLLALTFLVAAALIFGRGPFYWNATSVAALATVAAALTCVWGGAAEATGRTHYTKHWLGAAAGALLVAVGFLWLGRPTREHAARALASRDFAAAERELSALDGDGDGALFADLHLARVAGASDVQTARRELELIPRNLPQYARAVAAYLPLVQRAARDETVRARTMASARERLDARLAAERLWMEWEAASNRSGTPELMELRTSMARDVALLEGGSR
jgi:hypothetical protein